MAKRWGQKDRRAIAILAAIVVAVIALAGGFVIAVRIDDTVPIGGSDSDGSAQPNSGISGTLTYAGGPAPGTSDHPEPGELAVYSQDGTEVAHASFGEGEGFSIPLKPGKYRVVPTSGDAACSELTVDVVADEFVELPIKCSVM